MTENNEPKMLRIFWVRLGDKINDVWHKIDQQTGLLFFGTSLMPLQKEPKVMPITNKDEHDVTEF